MKHLYPLGLLTAALVILVVMAVMPTEAYNFTAQPVMTPKVDRVTGAVLTIDHEETEIHDGHSFTAHYENASAGAGEETAIGFITPTAPGARIHLIVDVWANDESVFEIRETPSVVVDSGSDLAVFNRDRSGDTSAMRTQDALPTTGAITSYNVAEANTANLSGGNILHHETLAISTGPPFASGVNGAARSQREFILKPIQNYVVILTQSGAGVATHNIILNWYEHIPGDFAN